MNTARVVVCLVALASLAAGCSESSAPLASPSATITPGRLSGTWTLVSIRPAGQTEQATPVGAAYALTFADGRLSVRADCNTCGGEFALSGQILTAGPALACTRAACPTMEFESAYTVLLSGEHTVTATGSTMVWTSPRGTLRFTR